MAATGTATLDFGSSPSQLASIAITGQTGIQSSSFIEAWIMPVSATANNTIDDQIVSPVRIVANTIVVGVGFTITGVVDGGDFVTGQFQVAWTWV
jgi:hypothetical protein